jgi:hypothetical protein
MENHESGSKAIDLQKEDFEFKAIPLILFGAFYVGYKGFLKEGLILLSFNLILSIILFNHVFNLENELLQANIALVTSLLINYLFGITFNSYFEKKESSQPKSIRSNFVNLVIFILAGIPLLIGFLYGEILFHDYYLEHGLDLKKRGNAKEASVILSRLCSWEMSEACTHLGILISEENTQMSKKVAVNLYLKSCKLKNSYGCLLLGMAHENGDGTELNFKKAFFSYTESCNLENGWGCLLLGLAQQQGHGTDVDTKIAFNTIVKSCDLQFGAGCFYLSKAYSNGIGVTIDQSKAQDSLIKACKIGFDGSEKYCDSSNGK